MPAPRDETPATSRRAARLRWVVRSDLLPLSRSSVDRDGPARREPRLLDRLLVDPATRVVLAAGNRVATTLGGALALAAPGAGLLPALDAPGDPDDPGDAVLVYLGRDEDGPFVGVLLDEADGAARVQAGVRWGSLREIGATLGDRDAGLATAAVALAAWHARHTRCAVCGERTLPQEAGWVRRCPADGSVHHPRTDPAVIVAVTDAADRLLLGHAAHWPARRFSLVAGYVEPGESLEAAVRREVAEECGLLLDALEYQGSQPWPFPASLMLGFRAAVAGGQLRVDGEELTDAMFVTRDDLAALVAAGEVVLPGASSIAHTLIEEWFGGPPTPP